MRYGGASTSEVRCGSRLAEEVVEAIIIVVLQDDHPPELKADEFFQHGKLILVKLRCPSANHSTLTGKRLASFPSGAQMRPALIAFAVASAFFGAALYI